MIGPEDIEPAERPRVVVGVDGSEDSLRAVRYAIREAQAYDLDLLVAHAVDDAILAGAWGVTYDPAVLQDAGREAAAHSLDYVVEQGFPADRVTSEVYLGNPGAVLSRLSEDAHTVVVGRRAKSGLDRLFVGSTSVSVAGSAQCPVIMVSAASNPERTGDKRLVGVGVDNTERSAQALRYACAEATHRGADVQVLHAFQVSKPFFADPTTISERAAARTEAAHRGVAEMVAPLRSEFPGLGFDLVVKECHPVDELLARTRSLDLLVLGVHGPGFPGMAPGGTIRAVMAHAECPLALVRHARR